MPTPVRVNPEDGYPEPGDIHTSTDRVAVRIVPDDGRTAFATNDLDGVLNASEFESLLTHDGIEFLVPLHTRESPHDIYVIIADPDVISEIESEFRLTNETESSEGGSEALGPLDILPESNTEKTAVILAFPFLAVSLGISVAVFAVASFVSKCRRVLALGGRR